MQDFKDIDKDKRSRRSGGAKAQEVRNAFKGIQETQPRKRRLKLILPVIALLLASYPIISLFGSTRAGSQQLSP